MTIAVTDTQTGQALSVRDVTREIARQDEAEYLPCPWGEQIEADLGCTFAAWSGQLDSFAADIRAVLAEYQHQPEPVFADLPPAPPVANQVYDQERGWVDAELDREDALKRMVRRKQAEDKWAQQGRVPEVLQEPPQELPQELPPSRRRRVRTWASGWAEWLKPSGGESDE